MHTHVSALTGLQVTLMVLIGFTVAKIGAGYIAKFGGTGFVGDLGRALGSQAA